MRLRDGNESLVQGVLFFAGGGDHPCFCRFRTGVHHQQQLDMACVIIANLCAPRAGDGDPAFTFAVEFEHRANNSIKRKEAIDAFAEPIAKPPHKVALEKPQKTVLLQLIKGVCGVAVVPRYKELCRLNMHKAAEESEEAEGAAAAPAQVVAPAQKGEPEAAAAPQEQAAAARPAPEAAAAAPAGGDAATAK